MRLSLIITIKRIVMLLYTVLTLLGCPAISFAQNVSINDLDISTILINQSDGTVRKPQRRSIELISEKVVLNESDSIEKVLNSNGIYADAESIGVIYKLNPGSDSNSISSSSELILPKAKGGRELSEAFKEGYLVALTVDREQKQQFLKSLKELEGLAGRLSDLDKGQFGSSEEKIEFIESIENIVQSMGVFRIVIRERAMPIDKEMLRQMNSESELLVSILKEIIEQGKKLDNPGAEAVYLVQQDFKIRLEAFDEERGPGELPPKSPEVTVAVKTINLQTGIEEHNLRVYYVPVALWNYREKNESSFNNLTSPANGILPVANYFIWAGKPGDSTPITDRKKLELRKRSEEKGIKLDLLLQ